MHAMFNDALDKLIRKASAGWLLSLCEALRGFPTTATTEFVIQRLPPTSNADLTFLATEVIKDGASVMSWESLGWTIQTAQATWLRCNADQHVELLWSGPTPADRIPARRIDQTLYDLIAQAKHEILLVTFAAGKIEQLATELVKAIQRDVKVRLILEFEQSSEGQLSYDALKAFPATLVSSAAVYHWPTRKRERNQAGKPGKLHAKVAIADDTAVISSANLTDDAFSRNFEMGIRVRNGEFLDSVYGHINSLIADGTLELVSM